MIKSYVFKRGILIRAYYMIKHDADRMKKTIVKESDIKISVFDQLTVEHNGYNFSPSETANIINALEENGFISYISCVGNENYYAVN